MFYSPTGSNQNIRESSSDFLGPGFPALAIATQRSDVALLTLSKKNKNVFILISWPFAGVNYGSSRLTFHKEKPSNVNALVFTLCLNNAPVIGCGVVWSLKFVIKQKPHYECSVKCVKHLCLTLCCVRARCWCVYRLLNSVSVPTQGLDMWVFVMNEQS